MNVAAMNVLAGGNGEAGQMSVAGRDAVSVVDHDGASVAAQEIGEGHNAVGRSNHCRSNTGGNIDTGVERAFSVKRIDALAKGAGHQAFDRPEIRSRVRADPVGRGGVLG